MPETRHQRAGQEGSRWVNARPTGDEVAAWFTSNVPMHEGLDATDFLTGVTLIPAKAKEDEIIGFRENGSPIIEERQNLYFVPYIKVETRVAYFWKLMELHDEWLGVIEPVGGGENGLPPGFFLREVRALDDKVTTFLCCTMQVRVWDRESMDFKIVYTDDGGRQEVMSAQPIMSPPPATKQVNVLGRFGPDENALMKAETGAIGRALGMAGILVAPGSGVATAEDMQDAMAAESRVSAGTASDGATLPSTDLGAMSEDELRANAKDMIQELSEHHPDTLAAFQEWARQRQFGTLGSVTNPALKGLVKKLQGMLDGARASSQQAAPEADVELGGPEEPAEPAGASGAPAEAPAGGGEDGA